MANNRKILNEKLLRNAIYILLAAGFIVSCSGDSEVGKGILTFLDAPVTEMSVGDLVILLVVIALIFK